MLVKTSTEIDPSASSQQDTLFDEISNAIGVMVSEGKDSLAQVDSFVMKKYCAPGGTSEESIV